MVTRDNVSHDKRLSGSITVIVDEVRTNPKSRRDAELSVRDEDGAELTVIIWETHQIDQSWEEGATYELTGARGKRYSTRSGTSVEVHSTKVFSAQQLDATNTTRILVLGDTHVGYRHRSSSDKARWAKNVNARDVFIRCLDRARKLDVDAVIHAGDVFDHENIRGDRNAVGQAISRTVSAGIPFYYIFGNHDDDKGRELLKMTTGTHLSEAMSPAEDSSVDLLGVDHSGQEFPTTAPLGSVDLLTGKNILVIHESPHPVLNDAGTLLYQNDGNRADISRFVDTADFDLDLVITGHLHVADRPRVRGYDVPVLVTGPTIPISSYQKDSNPSTWLLTATNSGIDLERNPV